MCRDGHIKSVVAVLAVRNSGECMMLSFSLYFLFKLSVVPTGTVDLITKVQDWFLSSVLIILSNTDSM